MTKTLSKFLAPRAADQVPLTCGISYLYSQHRSGTETNRQSGFVAIELAHPFDKKKKGRSGGKDSSNIDRVKTTYNQQRNFVSKFPN